jgi:hypothetical protein
VFENLARNLDIGLEIAGHDQTLLEEVKMGEPLILSSEGAQGLCPSCSSMWKYITKLVSSDKPTFKFLTRSGSSNTCGSEGCMPSCLSLKCKATFFFRNDLESDITHSKDGPERVP